MAFGLRGKSGGIDLAAISTSVGLCRHRLYDQDSVVAEWEAFLEGIAFAPRPHPVEWNNLAVDARNFSRPLAWCSSNVGGTGDNRQDDREAMTGNGTSDFEDAGGNYLSRADQEGSEDGSERGFTPRDSNVGRLVEDRLAKDELHTFVQQQPPSHSVPRRGRYLEPEEPTSGSTRSGWSTDAVRSGSRYLQTDDSENGNETEDRSRELLYAVHFSVASEHDAEPNRKHMAEVIGFAKGVRCPQHEQLESQSKRCVEVVTAYQAVCFITEYIAFNEMIVSEKMPNKLRRFERMVYLLS